MKRFVWLIGDALPWHAVARTRTVCGLPIAGLGPVRYSVQGWWPAAEAACPGCWKGVGRG